jgi:hypothetical protein
MGAYAKTNKLCIHTRRATGTALLFLKEQEGDDAWIAELVGGAFDAEVGEGAGGFAFFIRDATEAVSRLHGYLEALPHKPKYPGAALLSSVKRS